MFVFVGFSFAFGSVNYVKGSGKLGSNDISLNIE